MKKKGGLQRVLIPISVLQAIGYDMVRSNALTDGAIVLSDICLLTPDSSCSEGCFRMDNCEARIARK